MRPTATADDLQIAGLTRLSTCDWPGRLVATVFLQGCPLDCGYCHNPELLDPRTAGTVGWHEVRELLARRVGLLDGVVFSGGEPTRQAGLAAAMGEVRALGFGVGLHTAGTYPRRFAEVLPLCDWVGLDVKAPADTYAAVTGVASAAAAAAACLRLALRARPRVELQVRTTMDPTTMTPSDLDRLTAELRRAGVVDHVVQEVRTDGTRPAYAAALAAARVPTLTA
ncbi:anaerobic ribonucleoside-triphosphate reductase activating protein [Cellulomonas fimi]|uniref:Anaerobic ribonucleoside-triphosphate reductase activating protein n=1 Tax=Cellulomonas fimi TaxID=1708 RepID=A0A7Y0M030_CELFI|nr:anaerobic ribonucleoside-triphosphate reductase activating protein [Cellulomonas fimi]NMR21386.1 anaerobic ribonucleoside-triphosphate reductase activating protein [Cellulomonas fimi]